MRRHAQDGLLVAFQLLENLKYQFDELEEWEFFHVTVIEVLKAKTAEYQRLKNELVDHVATAAREYVKLAKKDPTSKAKPMYLTNITAQNLSKEDKEKFDRQTARKVAKMDLERRKMIEEQKAKGTHIMML